MPVWNEEENIDPFLKELDFHLANEKYEVIFVADPCTDNTIEIIKNKAEIKILPIKSKTFTMRKS